ncbi:MAG: helix-turn-helix domain-containing protein, partial [Planctomycetaceae bacterium]|nr:helix-turn-helix domain-containing protein [Planctomycetaceae bacterium]
MPAVVFVCWETRTPQATEEDGTPFAQDAGQDFLAITSAIWSRPTMSKKYLSLEEAANLLNIPVHELQRLRERGEVRGFADRGNWKFKQEDIENLARSLQADSNPDVPMIPEDNDATAMFDLDAGEGDSSDDVGEQPTVIRKDGSLSDDNLLLDEEGGKDPLADSDSDVRLVGGPEVEIDLDSDSDVKLAGVDEIPGESGNDGTLPEFQMEGMNSDSDVRLLGPDSDSNINLDSADSDSDVQLVGNDSASDV